MVNHKKIFNELISGKRPLDLDATNQMIDLLKTYPYLQPAQVLVTKYLKDKSLFYKDALQKAAVLSLDRKLLFQFIEDTPFVYKEETVAANDDDQIVETNNEKTTEVNTSEKIPKKVAEEKDAKSGIVASKKEKMGYLDWLQQITSSKETISKDFLDPIDRFLKNKPKIVATRDKTTKPPAVIGKSIAEKQMLMTETLANLYLKQKKYDKAIQAFKILSLKYPKKSSYFANQISEIKRKIK